MAHLLLTQSFRLADMTVLMPIDFTRLLFTSALAYLLFGQALDWWTALGAAFIIAGAVFNAAYDAHASRRRVKEVEVTDIKE